MTAVPDRLSTDERRLVLLDLVDLVDSDRRRHRKPRVWTDPAVAQLVERFSTATLPLNALVTLFLALCAEQSDARRGDATNGQIAIAELNSRHYLDTLVPLVPDGAP